MLECFRGGHLVCNDAKSVLGQLLSAHVLLPQGMIVTTLLGINNTHVVTTNSWYDLGFLSVFSDQMTDRSLFKRWWIFLFLGIYGLQLQFVYTCICLDFEVIDLFFWNDNFFCNVVFLFATLIFAVKCRYRILLHIVIDLREFRFDDILVASWLLNSDEFTRSTIISALPSNEVWVWTSTCKGVTFNTASIMDVWQLVGNPLPKQNCSF